MIVFDWFDGPREGVCALTIPDAEFSFECVAERYNPEGLDHRLYSISQLRSGAVDEIANLTRLVDGHLNEKSISKWKYNIEEGRLFEPEIDEILESAQSTNLILYTLNFREFLGCWYIDPMPDNIDELFDRFQIGTEPDGA